MASIELQHLCLDYPMYGMQERSFRKSIINAATGGQIAKNSQNTVVIRALDNINLNLVEGDRIGIMGHNGSGKSTLLKVMAGIYEPVSGTCCVNGRVSSMLNISAGMQSDLTGYENIHLYGKLMGMSAFDIAALHQNVIDFAGLGDYLHMPLRIYSSGMTMRLGFALSTAIPADILLMDEWVSVGDTDFSEKIIARLAQFVDQAKILVIASHSEETIRKNCNQLIRMQHGRIISHESL